MPSIRINSSTGQRCKVVSSLQRCISIGSGFGDRRRRVFASYLDQEKGQAEALTVWQGNSSSITDLLCAFKGLLAS